MSPVEPRLLRGFRDLLPSEVLYRDRVVSKIKRVYELYGFVPISTPAIEYKSTLLGYGEEASKQIYSFREPEGNEVGLRFDLTLPLSRVVAQYVDLPRPFKRYQLEPVWRYDKPDPGRYREFLQCDIDTVGTASVAADAEIIAAIYDSLTAVGLTVTVRFSNRKILNSLLAYAEIPLEEAHNVFRVLDKLEKQGIENVKLELGEGRVDASGAEIPGLKLTTTMIDKIERFLMQTQDTRSATLEAVEGLLGAVAGAEEGIDELRTIDGMLTGIGIDSAQANIDVSIARGLDYYTGPVFEAVIMDERAAGMGSIMGGGRYDDLIGQFAGTPVPATGASIGVDRLIAAVQKLGETNIRSSTADVLITVMDPDRLNDYANLAKTLRDEGINTELYIGEERSIGKQLKYADRMGIPVAVIAGSDEFSSDTVSIKDLRVVERSGVDIKNRKEWIEKKVGQRTVPMTEFFNEVKAILG